ncbi:PREDICTED: chaperone protein dnaJ 49-like [Camelina sativa]|uniref:Chaperone protein dnaJ 49-like n=1 Tax=Camelina sativa TaxID=90675 RepID=A0ABM0V617_CAMSA|nr:PREDICTED: chaperone protein dnaJ 49-like [Camelina sativa]
MTIDVYISASNKINGESDWYGVLGIDPLADDEAVKKRYKKLALLLHPDKNRFHGAEGAFKLVLQACDLLSDKVKRSAYDQKKKSKQVYQTTPKKSSTTFEAERPFKKRTTSGDANSTFEAERLFKKSMKTENENSTFEAERLFRNPMATGDLKSTYDLEWLFNRGNANSTFEAERLFKKPKKTENANSTFEAEMLFKNPETSTLHMT